MITSACSTVGLIAAPVTVAELDEGVTVADMDPDDERAGRPWYPKRSCSRLSFGSLSPSETMLLRRTEGDAGLLGETGASLRTASNRDKVSATATSRSSSSAAREAKARAIYLRKAGPVESSIFSTRGLLWG